MSRYKAYLPEGVEPRDAISEIEVCGGSDFEIAKDGHSVTFVADVDDIPAIKSMRTVAVVVEVNEAAGDERGMYVGLKRRGEG